MRGFPAQIISKLPLIEEEPDARISGTDNQQTAADRREPDLMITGSKREGCGGWGIRPRAKY